MQSILKNTERNLLKGAIIGKMASIDLTNLQDKLNALREYFSIITNPNKIAFGLSHMSPNGKKNLSLQNKITLAILQILYENKGASAELIIELLMRGKDSFPKLQYLSALNPSKPSANKSVFAKINKNKTQEQKAIVKCINAMVLDKILRKHKSTTCEITYTINGPEFPIMTCRMVTELTNPQTFK